MKKIKEKDMTVRELSEIMFKSFQSNQEYMDGKFHAINGRLDIIIKETSQNFTEVHKQLTNINRNMVDVIHKDGFDKLESRVAKVETLLPKSA